MIKLAPRNKGVVLTDLAQSGRLEDQRFCRFEIPASYAWGR